MGYFYKSTKKNHATESEVMIPVGKVLIGAGCPGLWAIPVAHDSLFTIAMGSMIMVMPRIIFSENYCFLVSQTKSFLYLIPMLCAKISAVSQSFCTQLTLICLPVRVSQAESWKAQPEKFLPLRAVKKKIGPSISLPLRWFQMPSAESLLVSMLKG